MKIRETIFILIYIFSVIIAPAQGNLGTITGDESALYAQTKQVNQFFRRFNNEEDRFGSRYYPGDSLYRGAEFRNVYMKMIFDLSSSFIDEETKKEFIGYICNEDNPLFLDFHGGLWFAELAATFEYYHNHENLILFLQIEQENLGYKWSITNVYFDQFLKKFNKGEPEITGKSFLHPMSHELDFMNIYKVFRDPKYSQYYASRSFSPDYRSLLFYELNMGNMKFIKAGALKFHFFQVNGWYFELSYFNRAGNNSGWLISKLLKINDQEKEELIKFYMP
jgi:hypothetical protein